MNCIKRIAFVASIGILAACSRQSVVPVVQNAPSLHAGAKSYFKTVALTGSITAMAPGLSGTLWFATCSQGAVGPCRIGYLDSTLTQTHIAGSFPFVNDLALGPDGNMWFDQGEALHHGHYLGRIDSAGHVAKIHLGGVQTSIVAGPDGNVWFDDSGLIARIGTDGTGLHKVSPTVAFLGGPARMLVFGPDKRLYFEYDKGFQNSPICALTPKTDKVQCFPIAASAFGGATPLLWAGDVLLARGDDNGPVFAMSPKGKQWNLQNGTTFFPEVYMPNGRLAGSNTVYSGDGLKLAQLTQTGFKMGRTFTVTTSSRSCGGGFGRIVIASDAHLWAELPEFGCLARFEVKE